ncbi:MAG: GYD domain-containing protein [Pseudomonadales bacterium]
MSTYIMLSTLTDEGRKTLKERPERLQEVNKELEKMGARVVSQHAVLGAYDFVNVIEAPSNELMAKISMDLGSRGTIKITTLPAMSIAQFTELMAAAPPKAGSDSA